MLSPVDKYVSAVSLTPKDADTEKTMKLGMELKLSPHHLKMRKEVVNVSEKRECETWTTTKTRERQSLSRKVC